MKYLKWTAIAVAAITGFAIYGTMSSGHSLQFAVLEAHPLFVAVTALVVLAYLGLAGAQKMIRR